MRGQNFRLLFVCLLLGMIVLSAPVGRAASVTVRVESVEGASGGEVVIPVTVQGASGIGALHLELIYDAAVLEALAVEKGTLLGDDVLLDFNTSEPGKLVIGLVSLEAIEGDGAVVMTRFTVRGTEGQSSPLRLENAKAWDSVTRLDLFVTSEDGEFTVSPAAISSSSLVVLAVLPIVILLALLFILRRRRRPLGEER